MNDLAINEMTTPPEAPSIETAPTIPPQRSDRWQRYGSIAMIVTAVVVCYSNTLHAPFVFDDRGAILGNHSLEHLWTSLFPSDKYGLAGRPFASLTFALNYFFGKENVVGYHIANVLIHLGAALLLFGVVRRTLQSERIPPKLKANANLIGGMVALIWAIHPVQTESVTYLSQRTESLMGVFYFLALYGFIRGAKDPSSTMWKVISILAIVLGALTKEVIVTAPFVILIYDRIFCSDSWRGLWERKTYYAALSLGWWIVLWTTLHVDHGDIGLGHGVGAWSYLMTSARSVGIYLKLAFYPKPLLFDYGTKVVGSLSDVWAQGSVIIGLLLCTGVALWRTPKVGFLGLWFFVILAPVSSFIPVLGQVTAEHRLYLSLAATVTLIVIGLFAVFGRVALLLLLPIACVLGRMTFERNHDYRSEIALWTDTVEKNPTNSRAYLNRGTALERGREISAALKDYEKAVELDPNSVDAHYVLALRFARNPARQPDAQRELAKVVELDPKRILALIEYGNVLYKMPGKADQAALQYEAALKLDPTSAEIATNLANTWLKIPGKFDDAIKEYDAAIRLNPTISDIHYMKAKALVRVPARQKDAGGEFAEAIRLSPGVAEYRFFYGVYLSQIKKDFDAAETQYREAVRLNPNYYQAHYNLGLVLRRDPKKSTEAIHEFEKVLAINPSITQAQEMIAKIQIDQALAPK